MKKIVIVFMLLLLTGCTVNYDVIIKDDIIHENISGKISKNEYTIKPNDLGINGFYYLVFDEQKPLINRNNIFYKKIMKDKNGYKEFNYSFDYNNNYKYSSVINGCFEKVNIEETDEYYNIHLGGNFYCKLEEPINVNVVTDYAVIENNSDKKNKNKYTWILDSEEEEIILKIAKISLKEPKKNSFNLFKIISFIIMLILICLTFLIYKVYEKNN